MEKIDALLAPIADESPCGESIRYAPEFDRLAAARREDDETLPTGVWQSTPHRADWEEVALLASDITTRLSKDLVVMGWLGEAWIKQHGISALPQALSLLVIALERYPETLHPRIREEDYDYRAAPLSWVAHRYSQLLSDTPFITDREMQVTTLTSCLGWLQRMNAVCQSWPATSAPSFSQLEQKIRCRLQELGGSVPPPQPMIADVINEERPAMTVPVMFTSREEAYQTLKLIAEYLQRIEPHSPVPYLLQRAHVWGHTPLPELLGELISGDEAARKLWKQLGVLP